MEISLRQIDELLANSVRKFPALYDKQVQEFHDKRVVCTCWELGAAETGNVHAKKDFVNLRKRYVHLYNSTEFTILSFYLVTSNSSQ